MTVLREPYRMMTSLGHAHFRFHFYGRLQFFGLSRISPWPLNRFSKFLRRLVGTRGAQRFWGINRDICPPLGGQVPPTKISQKVVFKFFWRAEFGLTSWIDSTHGALHLCKFLEKSWIRNSNKLRSKFLGAWHFFEFDPLGGPHPHVVITAYRGGRAVQNAVDRLSISTSVPELWRF